MSARASGSVHAVSPASQVLPHWLSLAMVACMHSRDLRYNQHQHCQHTFLRPAAAAATAATGIGWPLLLDLCSLLVWRGSLGPPQGCQALLQLIVCVRIDGAAAEEAAMMSGMQEVLAEGTRGSPAGCLPSERSNVYKRRPCWVPKGRRPAQLCCHTAVLRWLPPQPGRTAPSPSGVALTTQFVCSGRCTCLPATKGTCVGRTGVARSCFFCKWACIVAGWSTDRRVGGSDHVCASRSRKQQQGVEQGDVQRLNYNEWANCRDCTPTCSPEAV